MEAHRVLGCGFLEPVYQEALAVEFELRNIPYRREVKLPVIYKGRTLSCYYEVDFLCYDEVLVELKALKQCTSLEKAITLNYIKTAPTQELALLINFGAERLEFHRLIFSNRTNSSA